MKLLSWDSETRLITPGCQSPPMACLTYVWETGEPEILHWTDAGVFMQGMLQDPSVYFGTANGAFDFLVLAANFPTLLPPIFEAYEANRVFDVQVRERLLDIAFGKFRWVKGSDGKWSARTYDLASLARRHTEHRVDKSDPEIEHIRLSYGEWRDRPLSEWPQKRIDYAMTDALMTRDVFYSQERLAGRYTNVSILEDQHRQCKTDLVRKLISNWGLRTDAAAIDDLERNTLARFEQLKAELVTAGLVRANDTRDTSAAKQRMLAACGYAAETTKDGRKKSVKVWPIVPNPKKMQLTDSGDISLSSEACLESEDPILLKYGEYGEKGSVLSKDVTMLRLGTIYPVHTHYGMAESGRWTSAGPNVQNPRRLPGVREAFRPRLGRVFVQADVEGLEICTLGQACIDLLGYSKLADAINAGLDVHLDLASYMLQISYDEAKRRKKLGDTPHVQLLLEVEKNLKREPVRHEVLCTDDAWQDYRFYVELVNARQTAKVANFGFPGGLGVESMIEFAKATYGVILSPERCQWLKDLWLSKWPEMSDYFAWINAQMGGHDEVDIMQLRSKRIRGGCSYCAAANTLFQGLGADAVSAAGWQLAKECYVTPSSVMFGSRIVNMIHDEYILETDDNDKAHDVAMRLERVMIDCIQPWTPNVRIAAPPLLMRYWSKNAKAKYNEQGRLIPWQ